ncbi:phosphoribosylaminoimidazolesuccinocarboxamide synthase [Planotetraspora sp. A-T 1434]|uniref:phosphoribosylaminoimidazolesuccinocarboxamide synthase n=1 Tax=Planotetraspora sp. A-T 1434 TaxID=2979219 RepID=UPI0021C08C1A|nr:phosphoribosylaminoimidazolesuccinocarboxamide synthase [Planotetraspora sp. A-T 1434]MCT9932298.1 phosphoribosylaminoimidazolesuccinocarboxamide synthase [Planotetraspora sp. A-T 1434]
MKHLHSGKVRDLYETDDGLLLMVASDRISAFDYVLEPGIPDKGEILTRLSLWWFDQLKDVVPNHVVSADVPAEFAGRGVLCRKLRMVPVECVARGYLTGSGLVDYRREGVVSGVPLPPGLTDGSRLPEPIFTPSTKAPMGEHDEPMTFEQVVAEVGPDVAERLRRITLDVYTRGAEIALERGIILADTKIELGWDAEGELTLGDEVLTPDSSRFWPLDLWEPGHAQPSFDKQYVRDWLLSPESGWDRTSGEAPPPLPGEIVERTRKRYVEAFERLTGEPFRS